MLHRCSEIEQRISKIELPTIFPLDWPCFLTRPNLVSHSTWVCVLFANNAPSTGHARQCVSEHRWLQHGAPPFVSIRACFGPLWFPFGAASAPIGFHLGSASVRLGSVSVRCGFHSVLLRPPLPSIRFCCGALSLKARFCFGPLWVPLGFCFGSLWFPFGSASAPFGFHLGPASVRIRSP